MARYRSKLPQLEGRMFINDGGMETSLIFHEGVDLPLFASFVLLEGVEGRRRLADHYERFLSLAINRRVGIVLDTATWRANADWGAKLGYGPEALKALNIEAVALLSELRAKWEAPETPCVISGSIGPRGDGYKGEEMRADEAQAYHERQIAAFAEAEADMISAYTFNNVGEAIGLAHAAQAQAMPCAISFTVETDGRLATGSTIREAILAVDRETDAYPAYYGINCAHPMHFASALEIGAPWAERIGVLKANASTKSHAELDQSVALDEGDPADLGRRYRAVRDAFPSIRILGGCCGTDHRHVAAICEGCL